ncbi:MAG: hypothetical protein ACI8X5_001321 [Planctomycetota bacterium]|jgi:hypothetical protein
MKIEIGLVAFAFLGGVVAQDKMTAGQVVWVDYGENPMANPDFMAAWMASMTPGEHHAKLSKAAGDWDVKAKFWMTPDGPPMDAVGTSKTRTILGGRYILEEYSSEFMGMPYEGMLIQGYDKINEEYVSIWLDNMSTRPAISSGTTDDKGVLTSIGVMYDVSTPAGRPSKFISSPQGEDAALFQLLDNNMAGEEFKVFEMNYSRKK